VLLIHYYDLITTARVTPAQRSTFAQDRRYKVVLTKTATHWLLPPD
jgi:hypothetical protein